MRCFYIQQLPPPLQLRRQNFTKMPLFSFSQNPYHAIPLAPLSHPDGSSAPRTCSPDVDLPSRSHRKDKLNSRRRLLFVLLTSAACLSIVLYVVGKKASSSSFPSSSLENTLKIPLDAPGNDYLPPNASILDAFALNLTTSISFPAYSSSTSEDSHTPEDPFSTHNSLSYHAHNTLTLLTLSSCLALGKCGPNQTKVALLAAHWFDEAIVRGWRGGEGVWAISVYKNLRALGYTTLFSNSFEEALAQYRLFPSLVKVVIRNAPSECHLSPSCVKSPSNPTGIPAWKIFDFEFFPSPRGEHHHASKMGGKWILSANPDPNQGVRLGEETFQYIGYSIEDDCQQALARTNGTPPRLNERPRQAWILMKQLEYLYDHRFAWNASYFSLASDILSSSEYFQGLHNAVNTDIDDNTSFTSANFTFLGAWQNDPYYLGWNPTTQGSFTDIADPAHGVINLIDPGSPHSHTNPSTAPQNPQEKKKKKLNPAEFMQRVGQSRVMVGVGNPFMSPSPWAGLCLAVPFLNPIITWKHDDPWNKAFWDTQHPSLSRYEPPYVYHVHARNFTAFVQAIQDASTTEIPSFVPEHMTDSSIQRRLSALMETDWRARAEELLRERIKQQQEGKKDVYIFEL